MTKAVTLAVHHVCEPHCTRALCPVQPEFRNLERDHVQRREGVVCFVNVEEVGQRQTGKESFMATDAFVVVDEIATAIKDRFAAGRYLDPHRMMRRMPKDNVGAGALDQKPGETAAPCLYVVSPVPAPMDGDDDNVVR